ncbi:S41 family peptidase [Chitinophaga filiformis]|uniref:S41 family peptidase n=1 Tax=Chitinophaga filiformis TaxID=104663 RepID=UPI001F17FB9A|nr:S41 family peptidase [Chitinophaga filiformis]MCF6407830.1 S41 family peptidase [Chitinophaga filiformis]
MFTRLIKLLPAAVIICSSHFVSAQRGDSLKADLQLLKTKLETIHPALYAYTSQTRMEQLFDSCYKELNDYTDDRQFYGVIKVMLSAVKDGHLSSSPSPGFARFIHTENRYLPLMTYFKGDSIFIVNSIDNKIPAGSRLIRINSHPADAMRQKMYDYLMSDGYSTSKKALILNQIFYFYYYLAYGYSSGFTVEYTAPSGEYSTVALPATEEKVINTLKVKEEEKPLLSATFTEDNICILSIRTFGADDLAEAKLDYPAFLEKTFMRIKNDRVQKLIIDLRDNGGGRDGYGVMLYSYLTKQAFPYYSYLEKNKKKLSGKPGLGKQQPAAISYSGAVWVLTGGNTFSAAAEFCAVAYSNHRGTFIGEETGGGYEGNHSGQLISVELPSSKANVWIPTTKYVMNVIPAKYPGRGIIPHLQVQPSAGEYLRHEDTVLEKALSEARSR